MRSKHTNTGTRTVTLVALSRNTVYTPLALLYCLAVIKDDPRLCAAINVKLKEFELGDSQEFMLWEIAKDSPGIIGFSCYLWNIHEVLRLACSIKEILPKVKIVLGGPEVSPRARQILRENPHIDVVVRGEGEFTFAALIKAYNANGQGLERIKGISYRKAGIITDNPDAVSIQQLDDIPSAYLGREVRLAGREACLETQRGCVFGCSFCYYNKGSRDWRTFGIERVKKELSYLLSCKNTTIYLMDPVFNIDLNRAKEICRFIMAHNRYKIPFHTEIRAELVDEELAELLKRAHMQYVEVGLQTRAESILSAVGRAHRHEKFINGLTLLKNQGLVVELQLILGLPGETRESFERTIDFAVSLQPSVLAVFKLQLLPGTRIRQQARLLGIEYEKEPPYEFIKSRSMSFREYIYLQKVVNSLPLFRKDPRFISYCREKRISPVRVIRRWLDFMQTDAFLLNGEDNRALDRSAKAFLKTLK